MRFGERIRQLRRDRGTTQRDLAAKVNVEFSYISKIENGRLDFGSSPSESLIHRLAEALGADEIELLLLAERVPEIVKRRILDRPEAFLRIAALDDRALDRMLAQLPPGAGQQRK